LIPRGGPQAQGAAAVSRALVPLGQFQCLVVLTGRPAQKANKSGQGPMAARPRPWDLTAREGPHEKGGPGGGKPGSKLARYGHRA